MHIWVLESTWKVVEFCALRLLWTLLTNTAVIVWLLFWTLMQRITPRVPSTLSQELYVFGAAGLQEEFIVRLCVGKTDMAGIEQLVYSLSVGDVLLADVRQYVSAARDSVSSHIIVNIVTSSANCCISSLFSGVVGFVLVEELPVADWGRGWGGPWSCLTNSTYCLCADFPGNITSNLSNLIFIGSSPYLALPCLHYGRHPAVRPQIGSSHSWQFWEVLKY